MAILDFRFSQGIALVLQGESLKASCYVTHGTSLGTLREKMVSRFVRDETPDRYRVETGFIRNHQRGITSRQCDLLVHEPGVAAPLYRWEDFVVVEHQAARAVVEVKSDLDQDEFGKLLAVYRSVLEAEVGWGTFIPTFGYALKGVTFETFLTYIQQAARDNALQAPDDKKHVNWPLCVAVQERKYIGFRAKTGVGRPFGYYALDFSKVTDQSLAIEGIETGYFLQFYSHVLKEKILPMSQSTLDDFFHALPIADEGKAWVGTDGTVHRGRVP
jgi:hypothetical protein